MVWMGILQVNQSGWPARRNARRNPPKRGIQKNKFSHILLDEFEMGGCRPGARMLSTDPVHKIVQADDFVAARQQQVGQVLEPQKTGGTSDDGDGWGSFQYVKWFTIVNCLTVHLMG